MIQTEKKNLYKISKIAVLSIKYMMKSDNNSTILIKLFNILTDDLLKNRTSCAFVYF